MDPGLVYRFFFVPGEVVEIRAYGLSGKGPWAGYARGAGVVYGYFDNQEDFGQAAKALDKAEAPGIYYTLNPVNPDLLARAANRLKAADQKSALTKDGDVVCVRWLPIDLDPVRESGISSTKKELEAAVKLRGRIGKWLHENFVAPVPAVSGNGAHMLLRLPDLPNTDDTKTALVSCLKALAYKFDTPEVKIDQAVYNPARIWRIYGTIARKGDSTKTRPHRQSYIEQKYIERD